MAQTGAKKKWISYWNNLADDRDFASMRDIYYAARNKSSFRDENLTSLMKDLEQAIFLTSSRIYYDTNILLASIITHADSRKIKPVENAAKIPEYRKVDLKYVLKEKEGLSFLQALFGTSDGSLLIETTLEKLSRYPIGNILIWTPDLLERKTLPQRAVGLLYHEEKLYVMCCFSPNNDKGRSRGVRRIR